VLKQKQTKHK